MFIYYLYHEIAGEFGPKKIGKNLTEKTNILRSLTNSCMLRGLHHLYKAKIIVYHENVTFLWYKYFKMREKIKQVSNKLNFQFMGKCENFKYLASNGNFRAILVPKRAPAAIRIIKNYRNSSLCNSSLTLLVHQLLQIRSPNLLQICDAQNKTNRVEDVWLARSVQTRNCVEVGVETWYHCSSCVGFKPL